VVLKVSKTVGLLARSNGLNERALRTEILNVTLSVASSLIAAMFVFEQFPVYAKRLHNPPVERVLALHSLQGHGQFYLPKALPC